jgi:hypothetical protein
VGHAHSCLLLIFQLLVQTLQLSVGLSLLRRQEIILLHKHKKQAMHNGYSKVDGVCNYLGRKKARPSIISCTIATLPTRPIP